MTRSEKLAKMAGLVNENLENDLNDKQEDISILEGLKDQLSSITNKIVVDDNYLGAIAGRISGIMHHVLYNPKFTKDMLIVLNIKMSALVKFMEIAPQLPYIDKNREVVEGQIPDIDNFKNLLIYLAVQFKVVLEEDELEKITMEKFEHLYNKKMDAINRTLDLTAALGIKYDE